MKPGHTPPGTCIGFTLLELLVVVAVTLLLLAIAIPGYQDTLRRSHRAQAINELMGIAACQETQRATKGAYELENCLPSPGRRYVYRYREDSTQRFYAVTAEPWGVQAADPCGSLTLEGSGARLISAKGKDASKCWSAR